MTIPPRIVLLDRETFAPEVELTAPAAAHDWAAFDRSAPEEVVERLAGAIDAATQKAAAA